MTALSLTQPFKNTLQTDLVIQNFNTAFADSASSVAEWGGRTVNATKEGLIEVGSKSVFVTQKVLNATGSIASDTNMVATIFRRLNGQVFNAIEHIKKIPGHFNKIKAAGEGFVGWVDALQFIDDIDYFSSKKYKADGQVKVASRIALCVANVGGTLLWLQELSFFTLSKAAKALGEIRVFSFVPKVIASIPLVRDISSLQRLARAIGEIRVFGFFNQLSLGLIAGRALSMYYLLSAVESLKTLTGDHAQTVKTQAGLNLAYYLSELTLDAMLTVGVSNIVGLGVVGATCIATAVTSFAYKNYK